MEKANRASLEFSLQWQSLYSQHNDRYFSVKTDFWRDFFPGTLADFLPSLPAGETHSENFNAGVLVPPFKQNNIITFREKLFESKRGDVFITPRAGRFYPQGFAWSPLHCFSKDFNPFRIIKVDNEVLLGDKNHPLATYQITLTTTFVETLKSVEERCGTCNDIAEMVTSNGPGMQIPYTEHASDEYLNQPLDVLSEIARVTKPGGIFITIFSDRWFPGKEILPWSEMHPLKGRDLFSIIILKQTLKQTPLKIFIRSLFADCHGRMMINTSTTH